MIELAIAFGCGVVLCWIFTSGINEAQHNAQIEEHRKTQRLVRELHDDVRRLIREARYASGPVVRLTRDQRTERVERMLAPFAGWRIT